MFRVIIRARNAEKLIGKTLKSLVNQRCENWEAVVSLDAATDATAIVVGHHMMSLPLGKLVLRVRHKNIGVAGQMYSVPHEWSLNRSFDDEDILVFLDGDGDKLHPKALRIVERTYEKHPECLLTYGSYEKKSVGRRTKISHAIPDGANVRKYPWRASHLKTMKWKLFKDIPQHYFKHKGKWLQAASDVALMIPAIERAGLERCRHIHRILYYYRDDPKLKKKRALEKKCEKIVRAKKPLKRRDDW